MNEREIREIIKNFNPQDWQCKDGELNFYNSPNVILRLSEVVNRLDHEILNSDNYDEIFSHYNTNYIVEVEAFNGLEKLDIATCTLLKLKDALIPMPIAANIITTFYENEYLIGRKFNDNIVEFDNLMKNAKFIKRKF